VLTGAWFDRLVNVAELLAVFEEQMRRNPAPEPGTSVERETAITRIVGAPDTWRGVTWSDLRDDDAGDVIHDQIKRLSPYGDWEWKLYSYDQPTNLSERLVTAGFVREADETVLVAALDELDLVACPPPGVEFVPVVDGPGVDALVAVHDEVFGGTHDAIGRVLLAGLEAQPTNVAAVLAVANGVTVSAGRVEFPQDRDLASIWGGGTLPAWRGRGVFRSLVAHRAALAAARGYRYLQVDASPDSCPVLKRLGFTELATTTPHQWSAGSARGAAS
jgi:GNAT superfamily N-acetyltransferase